ncbi:hypothetical protein [Winogradskyella sp.]
MEKHERRPQAMPKNNPSEPKPGANSMPKYQGPPPPPPRPTKKD